MKKLILILSTALLLASCSLPPESKVTGVIYGKSQGTIGRGTTVYTFAISPLNKKEFHDFDINVRFSNFAKFKVGDTVTYTVFDRDCRNGY